MSILGAARIVMFPPLFIGRSIHLGMFFEDFGRLRHESCLHFGRDIVLPGGDLLKTWDIFATHLSELFFGKSSHVELLIDIYI